MEALVEELLNTLGNPVTKSEFLQLISRMNVKLLDISKVVQITNDFIKYFGFYLKSKDFRDQIYKIITISYEICEDLEDLNDILLKTTIVNLIDIYLEYSKISGNAKDSVLNILGSSFGVLAPGAQVLNVCVMIDPILNSVEYRNTKKEIEEVEVQYKTRKDISNIELIIKKEIDHWIKVQHIDLEKQDELVASVKKECKRMAEEKGLKTDSPQYQELELQSIEMMRMQINQLLY
jgi:hypothetical protein